MSAAGDDGIPRPTPGTLLVVDDDESNRDMLSRRLERKGYRVVTAEGGRRALELIAGQPFDAVLLDVMMPEVGGLEVLRRVRETTGPAELPVIMATARNQSEDIVEALRMGANDYVTKPLDFAVVLARVQTQIVMKRAVEAAAELERRLAERNRELEGVNALLHRANRRMERDLRAASRVQESFLPTAAPVIPGGRCAWVYRPCEELAGDGLNAFPLDDGHAALYVFDVCGHGVAAALLSVSVSRIMTPPGDPSSILGREIGVPGLAHITPPADVAERLNRMFPFEQSDQYLTMVYGVLDGDTGDLRFVSAGHPGLVHLPASGGAAMLDGRGFPVGLASGPFQEQTLHLGPGDRVMFYSDGIPEAMDPANVAFGNARMIDALERGRRSDMAGSIRSLVDDVVRWCGEPGPRDDVSVLAVERAASGSAGPAPHGSDAGGPVGLDGH